MELSKSVVITKSKIRSLAHNAVKSAEALNLIYVNDKQPGIRRIRKGRGFSYLTEAGQITDREALLRIKKLVIPPAWEQVWICASPDGHIQATGVDKMGRRQYRYHPLWNIIRKETKFFHLYDFGKTLPLLRRQVKEDLSLQGLPQQKVLAAVVTLMEYTGARIGSNYYEKLYGSYGITTLQNRHVAISGSEMKFHFIGKKGVSQNLTLKNKRLSRIVRQCKDIPGKELFQYFDESENRHPVDSGMVNEYIKRTCGKNFTAKDFRTWFGTLSALECFIELGHCDHGNGQRKNVVATLDAVAKKLGNTRSVCEKYYVHPSVIKHYLNNSLEKFIGQLSSCNDNELSAEEQVLMKVLENEDKIVINPEA